MADQQPCRHLPWDSEFFGHRIARLNHHQLSPKIVQAVLTWCEENFIECLYFLADSDHQQTVQLAQANGFQLVDVRLSFQHELLDLPDSGSIELNPAPTIRAAIPQDIQPLGAIARDAHSLSRFYFDPCFSTEICQSFYQTWIESSCKGYADLVLVAEVDSQPVGYATCHLPAEDRLARIGLLGIERQQQGKGIARALVESALRWFRDERVGRVEIVTHGRNIAAQRLYQRCGFRTSAMRLWYHRWFATCAR